MGLAWCLIAHTGAPNRPSFELVRWFLTLAALALAAFVVPTVPASANTSDAPFAVIEDCMDANVLMPGVEERVRERVPDRFELVRDPLGRPLLLAIAERCERYTVGGATKPTTSAWFVAIIESPDGSGCLSRWPVVGALTPDLVPVCNLYFLSGAYDNRPAVRTYRALFPGIALRYVSDLSLEAGDLDLTRLGAPLRFRGGSKPSPFELDGVFREQALLRGPATFSIYSDSSGTAGARLEIDDLALGQMDATLRAAPGSEMAHLLGSETPTSVAEFIGRFPHGEARLLPAAR